MVAPHLLAGSLTYGPPVRYALPLAQNDPRGGEVTGAPKYDDQKFVGGVQEKQGLRSRPRITDMERPDLRD